MKSLRRFVTRLFNVVTRRTEREQESRLREEITVAIVVPDLDVLGAVAVVGG